MLAKWVRVIVGIDGWDFFARLMETWGIDVDTDCSGGSGGTRSE
jgi:hypothetical protein